MHKVVVFVYPNGRRYTADSWREVYSLLKEARKHGTKAEVMDVTPTVKEVHIIPEAA